MNQTYTRSLLLIIALLTPCATAQSAVISMDLHQSGDGLLTYDMVNHREWLDLSQTNDQSLLTVAQSLESGGALYGFHQATVADASAFVASAGYIGTSVTADRDFSVANNLIDLLGQNFFYITDSYLDTSTSPYDKPLPSVDKIELVDRFASGLLRTDAPPGAFAFAICTESSGSYAGNVYFQNYQVSQIGSGINGNIALTHPTVTAYWLYRDAPIPEPTTLTLCAFTACAASFCRHRAR